MEYVQNMLTVPYEYSQTMEYLKICQEMWNTDNYWPYGLMLI